MKIAGRLFDKPKETILVLPRQDEDLVLRFVGVTDDKEFDLIYPEPQAQSSYNVKLGQTVRNVFDPAYKAKMQEYYRAHNAWVFLKSIAPSNIEWDTVKLDQPETWSNWQEDLKNAGFTINERNVIWQAFQECNALTDAMLQEARMRFLASQAALK